MRSATCNRSTQLVQQQLGAIQANAAVYEANIHKGVARFEADKQLRVVQLQTNIELSKLAVAKYGAMLESWRTRAQQILSTFQINAESLAQPVRSRRRSLQARWRARTCRQA
jgi:hypothetical protein